MEIKFLGQSCFRLKGKQITVVTDPYDPKAVGLSLPKLSAQVITVSHDHQDHNNVKAVQGTKDRAKPFVVQAPGEYEIGGVHVTGIKSYHDGKQGKERGKNVAYLIEVDGVKVAHLGDLGHLPDEHFLSELNTPDVLLIPVGGEYTLGPKEAVELITKLEPKMVIPMHYRLPGLTADLAQKLQPVEAFLKEMGVEQPEETDKLNVSTDGLSEETQVIVLKPSQ